MMADTDENINECIEKSLNYLSAIDHLQLRHSYCCCPPCWRAKLKMSTNVKRANTKGLLPDYYSHLTCEDAKKRYREKLTLIKSLDPYEIPKNEWLDDTEKWPSVSYIDVGMYLLFSESPYTKDQLLNYKSLDSYERFANGWVREVLVKEFAEKRLTIAKVCDTGICFIRLFFFGENILAKVIMIKLFMINFRFLL